MGRTDKLIALLEREASQATDAKEAAGAFCSWWRKLLVQEKNDAEAAVTKYREVLERLPGYLPAIKALSELYGRLTSRPRDLIEMNELLLEKSPDLAPEQTVYLLEQNSRLYEETGDLDQAIECRIRILDVNDKHLPSIQALGRLFAKTERFDKLVLINDKRSGTDPRRQPQAGPVVQERPNPGRKAGRTGTGHRLLP